MGRGIRAGNGCEGGRVRQVDADRRSSTPMGPKNEAKRAVPPAAPKSKAVPATPEQIGKLLQAAKTVGLDMEKVVALATVTGARPEELAALRWRGVSLRNGVGFVAISKAVTAPGTQKPSLRETKTGAKRRIRIAGTNLEALRLALGKFGSPNTFVIDGGSGPVRPDALSDRFRRVRSAARIRPSSGVTLYSLRHAWATHLLSAGVPIHTVTRVGGWTDAVMVLRTYGHAIPDDEETAALVPLL